MLSLLTIGRDKRGNRGKSRTPGLKHSTPGIVHSGLSYKENPQDLSAGPLETFGE